MNNKTHIIFIYPKSILSMVVRTQKIRCNTIPRIKKKIKVCKKEKFPKYAIKYATKTVATTSTTAILKIR